MTFASFACGGQAMSGHHEYCGYGQDGRVHVYLVAFAHGFIQLCLPGATFTERAKISTTAVPARTRHASYTGTWTQPRLVLHSREAEGPQNTLVKSLKHRQSRLKQKQEAFGHLSLKTRC